MGAEKIIELLMSGEQELVKQLLRGNPELLLKLVEKLADLIEEGAMPAIFTFGYPGSPVCVGSFCFYSSEESGRELLIHAALYNCTVGKIKDICRIDKKMVFVDDIYALALATLHNIEAIVRAWMEGRELK
ncbi:MAG: hypothetical protein VKL39_12975, partial [Leptolyngbyaceae bacterium]|nr:hypothetical protein [Leptolyngbyaceae bacterium]